MDLKTIIHQDNPLRDTLAYVGGMAGVEGVSHMDIDPTVKLVCQTLITVTYLAYAGILLVKKIKELKNKNK